MKIAIAKVLIGFFLKVVYSFGIHVKMELRVGYSFESSVNKIKRVSNLGDFVSPQLFLG